MSESVPDLVKSLDEAAEYLLKQACASPKNAEGAEPTGVEPATLAEQVKAFQAVVAWADKRRDLLPKVKEESKFDRLAGQFSSPPVKRRRSRPAQANGADADSPVGDGDGYGPPALDS